MTGPKLLISATTAIRQPSKPMVPFLGKARRQRQHAGVQQQNDAAGDSLGRAARQL